MRYVQVGLGYRYRGVRTVLGGLENWQCCGVIGSGRTRGSRQTHADLVTCLDETTADLVIFLSSSHVDLVETCVERGVHCLIHPLLVPGIGSEVQDLAQSGLVHVGEYFPFTPSNLARKRAIDLGVVGNVTQVQVFATGIDHAVALIRYYLGTGSDDALVQAHPFASTLLASLDFGSDRTGLVGVSSRSSTLTRLHIKATDGEINGDQVVHLSDQIITTTYLTHEVGAELTSSAPGTCDFTGGVGTPDSPQVEPSSHRHPLSQISFSGQILWTNQYPHMPWSEEELGIAHYLTALSDGIRGTGLPPYFLSQGLVDFRLSQAVKQAVRESVGTVPTDTKTNRPH